MPALDALCDRGAVARVATTPDGLRPGSEVGIPTLLGAAPTSPVDRGRVEAAAAEIDVPPGAGVWRIDLHHADGGRSISAEAMLLAPDLAARLPDHEVVHLKGHRFLAVGRRRPEIRRLAMMSTHIWDDGQELTPVLDRSTVVIAARGAAAGCRRLLGAEVVTPIGATATSAATCGPRRARRSSRCARPRRSSSTSAAPTRPPTTAIASARRRCSRRLTRR